MALEQFLEEGEMWDLPVVGGPGKFAIARWSTLLVDTGFTGSRGEIQFTCELDNGMRSHSPMIYVSFAPAFTETEELGKPVLYVRGEIFNLHKLPVGQNHTPVRGLYSVDDHNGGFMVIGNDRHHDHGYHFRESHPVGCDCAEERMVTI